MSFEFCPDLQASWCIRSISMSSLDEIKVTLHESAAQEYPSPIGRHGKDVLSYPAIYKEFNEVTFYFTNCKYFNVRDNVAPGYAEDDVGEGSTFQRLLSSELLSLHENRSIDNLIHYRIVCSQEIIDIACYEPPTVIKKLGT